MLKRPISDSWHSNEVSSVFECQVGLEFPANSFYGHEVPVKFQKMSLFVHLPGHLDYL